MIKKLILVAALALSLGVAACFQRTPNESNLTCKPGFSSVCYTGPEGTRDKGLCHAGFSVCSEENGVMSQNCFGQVLPTMETCNQVDDDCDGKTDEGNVCTSGGAPNPVYRPGRIGPALLHRANDGLMFECGKQETTLKCANRYLDDNYAAWGVNSVKDDLSPDPSGDTTHTTTEFYYQRHVGIPVEGRWISIHRALPPDARGNGIVAVRANLAPLSTDLPTEAVITPEQAINFLPEPGDLYGKPELIYHDMHKMDTDHENWPVFRLTYEIKYKSKTSGPTVTWISAADGKILGSVRMYVADLNRTISDESQPNKLWNEQSPPDASDVYPYEMWNTIADWRGFVLRSGVVIEKDGLDENKNLDWALKIDLTLNHNLPPCNEDNLYSCYYRMGLDKKVPQIFLCRALRQKDDKFKEYSLIHELGHQLTGRYWDWPEMKYTDTTMKTKDAMELAAIIELYPLILTKMYKCNSKSDCSFKGDRDFSKIVTKTQVEDYIQKNNIPVELQPYYYAKVPGSVLHEIYKREMEKGLSSALAVNVVTAITISSMWELGDNNTSVDFMDFFTAIDAACNRLAGRKFLVNLGAEGSHAISNTDCMLLKQAFAQAEIVTTCEFPVPNEDCNGIDDNCNGLIDEDPANTFNPLTKSCPWDGSSKQDAVPEVGECRNGIRTCYGGQWGPCENAVTPRPEVCDQKDNNCNGLTDEGVNKLLAPDSDKDGYWADKNLVYMCPQLAPPNYILKDQSKPDCNDDDYAINPGVAEKCGDMIDNNCNGVIDETCPCNQATDQPIFCGIALASSCIGDDFDSTRVASCTRGDHTWCTPGQQKCEYNWQTGKFEYSKMCYGSNNGGPEVCDGLDNDCNGLTDDNVKGLSNGCGNEGHEECSNGKVICTGEKPQIVSQGSITLPRYVPPLTAGDADFYANGPKMEASVSISLSSDKKSLLAKVCLTASEVYNGVYTQGESRASGCMNYQIVSVSNICKIKGNPVFSNNSLYASKSYIDSTTSEYYDIFPGSSPAQQWSFIGDTDGNEAGTRTSVQVTLAPFTYELKCTNRIIQK